MINPLDSKRQKIEVGCQRSLVDIARPVKTLIVSYLSSKEIVCTMSLVNKEFCDLTQDDLLCNIVKQRFEFPFRVVEKSDWNIFFSNEFEVDDEPGVKQRKVCAELLFLSKFKVVGNAGWTLLTIPKSLTLANVEKLSEKIGKVLVFPDLIERHSNTKPKEKSYRIFIANDALVNDEQWCTAFIPELRVKAKFLEFVAFVVTTHLKFNLDVFKGKLVTVHERVLADAPGSHIDGKIIYFRLQNSAYWKCDWSPDKSKFSCPVLLL